MQGYFTTSFVTHFIYYVVSILLTTLDQLESYVTKQQSSFRLRKIIREIKTFGLIFLVVSGTVTLVTNWTLFAESLGDIRKTVNSEQGTVNIYELPKEHGSAVDLEENRSAARQPNGTENKTHILVTGHTETAKPTQEIINVAQLDTLVDTYTPLADTTFTSQEQYASAMKKKLDAYAFNFNTLPPTNRLIIPKADQNIPLVAPSFGKPIDEVQKGDFAKELFKGVVRYPTTAIPGTSGNTLIFGHTSYEAWEHNPYATIFRSLGRLNVGDTFQIVWEGHLYTYTIVERKVVKPKQVNNEFIRYNKPESNFVTLMGCYPFGSDAERILVIGELVK